MITIVKFTAILAIAAILALSPFMTMTALAVKGDFGGSNTHSTNNNDNNNIKHFGGDGSSSGIHSNDNNFKHFDNGGNDKQITPTVTKGGNNNNNNNIDRHFNKNNNDNNNFKNFERDNNNFDKNFKHNNNDNFKNFKHNDGYFRFHDNNHNDNVKVIHKTVVVHDRDNNQRTIVINSKLQGTCFVTQSQAANVDNLVAQLLDQCISVTIIQG
jgi:hypothetical protein